MWGRDELQVKTFRIYYIKTTAARNKSFTFTEYKTNENKYKEVNVINENDVPISSIIEC